MKYSNKYSVIEFTLKHKRYCDKHGIDSHTADIKEINKAMLEELSKRWKEQSKAYYQEHRDKVLESMRKHRLEHHDEILEKKKEYAKLTCICECGCQVLKNNLSTHKKTPKHKKLMEEIISETSK